MTCELPLNNPTTVKEIEMALNLILFIYSMS